MTNADIKNCFEMLRKRHGGTVDEKQLTLWQDIFQNLDAKIFAQSCEKFLNAAQMPEPSEIIAVYMQIKNANEQKQAEKTKATQKHMTSGQIKCFLCDNSGICRYKRGGYEYGARCVCAHGRDLNRFSRAETDAQHQSDNKNTTAYIPTIKEALGADFAVYEAQKKAQKLESKNMSDEEKFELLKRFQTN